MLKHLDSEIILHFEKLIIYVKVIKSNLMFVINKYKTCAFIKIHKLIFRKSKHDKLINALFVKIEFNLS